MLKIFFNRTEIVHVCTVKNYMLKSLLQIFIRKSFMFVQQLKNSLVKTFF